MTKSDLKKRGYFSRLKFLFFHPKRFFNSIPVKKESRYAKIIFFYVIIASAVILLNLIFSIINSIVTLGGQELVLSLIWSVFTAFMNLGLAFIIPFFTSAIIHLGVLIFRGKQGYFNTYKPAVYSSAIGQVYNLVIGFLFGIIFLFFLRNIDLQDPTVLASNPLLLYIGIGYLAIFLISFIHILYSCIIGVAKFQKMTKLRAFFSVIIIPLIILILFIALFILAIGGV